MLLSARGPKGPTSDAYRRIANESASYPLIRKAFLMAVQEEALTALEYALLDAIALPHCAASDALCAELAAYIGGGKRKLSLSMPSGQS